MRNKIAIIIACSLFTVSALHSCKVIQPEKSYSKVDSTTTKFTPVDVNVKGAKVGTSLNIDSLKAVYQRKIEQYRIDSAAAAAKGLAIPPPPETDKESLTDPQTKAQLTYWIDKYGKLQLGCESKDQVVTMLTAEITRLTKEVTNQKQLVKEIPGWAVMLFGVLGTLFFISLLFNIILFKTKKQDVKVNYNQQT